MRNDCDDFLVQITGAIDTCCVRLHVHSDNLSRVQWAVWKFSSLQLNVCYLPSYLIIKTTARPILGRFTVPRLMSDVLNELPDENPPDLAAASTRKAKSVMLFTFSPFLVKFIAWRNTGRFSIMLPMCRPEICVIISNRITNSQTKAVINYTSSNEKPKCKYYTRIFWLCFIKCRPLLRIQLRGMVRVLICCFPQVNSKTDVNVIFQTLLTIADVVTHGLCVYWSI